MLKRKEKILISAIELLNAEGVNGVTTKNIARLQHFTEPALYRQYNGKQDVLNDIIEEYAGYDTKIINTIQESGLAGKEAVLFFVKRYAELYQNYFELTTVMFSMDLYQYNDFTRNRMQEIMKSRLEFLETVIRNNIEEFGIHNKYNEKELASMINGIIISQVFEWRMMDKGYQLDKRILDFVLKLIEE